MCTANGPVQCCSERLSYSCTEKITFFKVNCWFSHLLESIPIIQASGVQKNSCWRLPTSPEEVHSMYELLYGAHLDDNLQVLDSLGSTESQSSQTTHSSGSSQVYLIIRHEMITFLL